MTGLEKENPGTRDGIVATSQETSRRLEFKSAVGTEMSTLPWKNSVTRREVVATEMPTLPWENSVTRMGLEVLDEVLFVMKSIKSSNPFFLNQGGIFQCKKK